MEDLDKLVRVYLRMRDKKSELNKAHDEEIAKIDVGLKKIEATLLQYCKESKQEGGRTDSGSFSRSIKSRVWPSDWDLFKKFVLENGAVDLLEKRINQSALSTFLAENPEKEPPGLNKTSEYVMTVRRPPKNVN